MADVKKAASQVANWGGLLVSLAAAVAASPVLTREELITLVVGAVVSALGGHANGKV